MKRLKTTTGRYIKMKTGALPSPRYQLAAATPHKMIGVTPDTYLKIPNQLSYWGNNRFGDCVTAEEAFAKACYDPEIFIEDQVAIDWAAYHGILDSAGISDVLQLMTTDGFFMNGLTYIDGLATAVNYDNTAILRNAISIAPVKIGIFSDQLNRTYSNSGQQPRWIASGFQKETLNSQHTNSHCGSLCGFGTLAWLANQMQINLSANTDGNANGYALFTWNSIAIIDDASLQNIIFEAWLRNPTTKLFNPTPITLQAYGGVENGQFLRHANGQVSFHNGHQGDSSTFMLEILPNNTVALACAGADQSQYLSHAFNKLGLAPVFQGNGEVWVQHDLGNNYSAFECLGSERGRYLSHINGQATLQTNYLGDGEKWLQTRI